MRRTGTHITFVSTLAIASILTCGLSQGKARPEHSAKHIQVSQGKARAEHSAKHIQVHRLPKSPQKIAIHITSTLQSTTVKKPIHLAKDVTASESQETVESLVPHEGGHSIGNAPAELKVTPSIQDTLNTIRPKQLTGMIKVQEKEYQFGSGGLGQSIPYGDYLITPDAVGSWGSKHEAIGVADGTILDPKLHRDRDGIELHAATNSELKTHGCVAIRKDQWPEFRNQVLAMVKENKSVYLHVSEQGASVSTEPFEFIGESISGPTFQDVLGLIDEPIRKAPELTPSSRCCRLMRVKTKHTHKASPMIHSEGRAAKRRRA